MILVAEKRWDVPLANNIKIGRPTAEFLLKLDEIGEREAGLKLLVRNALRLEDAKKGIDGLVELRDWQALESLASYAGRVGACKLALKALTDGNRFDEIVNAIYTTRHFEVVKFGVRMLIEKGEIERLQNEGIARGYGKNVFAAIARELARAINEIIEKPDNTAALLRIAGSRLEYLQTESVEGKYPDEEIDRVLSAINGMDNGALVGIARQIEDEFLAESKK